MHSSLCMCKHMTVIRSEVTQWWVASEETQDCSELWDMDTEKEVVAHNCSPSTWEVDAGLSHSRSF